MYHLSIKQWTIERTPNAKKPHNKGRMPTKLVQARLINRDNIPRQSTIEDPQKTDLWLDLLHALLGA